MVRLLRRMQHAGGILVQCRSRRGSRTQSPPPIIGSASVAEPPGTSGASAALWVVVLVIVLVIASCSSRGQGQSIGNQDDGDTAGPAVGRDATNVEADGQVGLPVGDGSSSKAIDGEAEHQHGVGEAIVLRDPEAFDPSTYGEHLNYVLSSPYRNTNHDDSRFLETPSAELPIEELLGPRSDYLGNPGGNPEQSFPVAAGGQFRAGCEFSHFAYDDPLVFPDQPWASHLHMFFGNTHVNAFSTFATLQNSGSSTCNGQELNRTGYWAPALFDAQGNVRIPERVVVYYKGEGKARGNAIPFPDEAALIATENINDIDTAVGGARGKFSFVCSDNFSSPSEQMSNTIPVCNGRKFLDKYGVRDNPGVVLEMNVKFPICWNGQNPADWANNYGLPRVGNWYGANCDGEFSKNLVNLEYFINYRVGVDETTDGWYLSSDVDPKTYEITDSPGASVHADWWGGWHSDIAQRWIDNCVNYKTGAPSGCGFGYLTDGGPNGKAPFDGPALKYRPQYEGPQKVPAKDLWEQLCGEDVSGRPFTRAQEAAYCRPIEVSRHD